MVSLTHPDASSPFVRLAAERWHAATARTVTRSRRWYRAMAIRLRCAATVAPNASRASDLLFLADTASLRAQYAD